MSNVFYFQRYSQKENWLTNSTLLLLSRLQHYSRAKFQEALRNILKAENEVSVGFSASQQIKGNASVADGVLEQKAIKIVVEAKLYNNFSAAQLKAHLELFKDFTGKGYLIGISQHCMPEEERKNNQELVSNWAKENKKDKDIVFINCSYASLIDSINKVLDISDLEMKEIVDDYLQMCLEQKVIDRKAETMLTVTCSASLEDNLKYDIYYDPVDRNHNYPFKYMALYAEKSLQAIGEVDDVISCWYDATDNQLKTYDSNQPISKSKDVQDRIKGIITNNKYHRIDRGSKFFLLKNLKPCNIPYPPIRQKKYEYLNEATPSFSADMSVSDLIDKLKYNWKEK